jgi:hypothetical protein
VHSYRRANDPQALVKGLSEVVAEIGGTKDDAASAEAMAAIEPIPDEMARAMLDALVNSASSNQPIGERPIPETALVPANPSRGPAPGGNASSPPGPVAPQAQSGGAGVGLGIVCLLSFAIFALVIFVAIKKAQMRG